MNRIGFHRDPEPDPDEEKKKDITYQLLSGFLSTNYVPIGPTDARVYKTSKELAYDLRDIVLVTVNEISKTLSGAGYKLEYISGVPYWVMYEKTNEESF